MPATSGAAPSGSPGGPRDAGFTTAELIETPGHPAVYRGEVGGPGAAHRPDLRAPRHPAADPLEEWTSPPFERGSWVRSCAVGAPPTTRAWVWMHLKAVEAHLRTRGDCHSTLKLVVEGEEEIGSANSRGSSRRGHPAARRPLRRLRHGHARPRPALDLASGCVGWSISRSEVEGPALGSSIPESSGGAVLNPIEGARPHPRLPAIHRPDG